MVYAVPAPKPPSAPISAGKEFMDEKPGLMMHRAPRKAMITAEICTGVTFSFR